jgi:[protein-PII] uridylyltransferase
MSTSETPPPFSLHDLRARFTAARAELLASVPTASGATGADDVDAGGREACGLALGRKNARILDDLLVTLFRALRAGQIDTAASPALPPAAWDAVELAGVGSYGRGAVALKSDLDIRLLAKNVDKAAPVADALLYPLWDMGVSVGHQVVTVDDLLESARTDLPAATSLLEWRHVAGDVELGRSLRKRAAEGLFAHSELPRFLARLEEEVAQRHSRFGGSVYLLEPDVKNGAGGLRDLDVARWAAKARFGAGEPEELVRIGALVPREAAEIIAASEMLFRVRNLLHAHAGRRSDRLTFDEQESIATLLGYGDGLEAVADMMSAYYRAARTISRSLDMILSRAAPVLSRRKPRDEDLGSGVRLFDGSATMSDPELLRSDPALSLRLVAAAVERGVPILPYARDAIVRASADPAWAEHLRAQPEAGPRFAELVSTCRETTLRSGSVMRELHDTGLLLAMIPEFSPVVGRVHHDTYHVYTVDVHSVAAVDRLVSLVRGDLAAEFPLACRLAAELVRPRMLFFATLLHDVGKAIGGTDHSQRGAEMAGAILQRFGLSPEDVDEACHLIRKHLVMYHVATRRDLDDPATVRDFSRDVHGREGLRDLYLLTVADLSTTSPTSMTSWKARMLDELYLATDAALGGVSADDTRKMRALSEVDREVDALPSASPRERSARRAFLAEFIGSMPERYLLANTPKAIVAHAELARNHHDRPASAALVPSRHPEAAEICVIARDRPGLLAAITAAIAASRLEVHAAQIHTRAIAGAEVQAVDLFWVRDRGEGVSGVARALPKLERDLAAILAGEASPIELARKRSSGQRVERSSPKVKIQVSVDDRASPRHTVIEVVARDRPGLLFAISEALHGLRLSISVAKINTEGTRVADVFYVSEADGTKVAPGKRSVEVQTTLLAALEGLEEERAARPA